MQPSYGLPPKRTRPATNRRPAGFKLLLRLGVVLLAVNPRALAVFLFPQARLLFRADVAVGAGVRLGARVARLAGFELRRLACGERAGLGALLDAVLLVDVALHVGLHPLRGSGIRIAGLRVVLLTVDVAAHAVLLALQARLLRGAQVAIAHGAGLIALDSGLFLLELRCFARVETA